MQSAAENLDPSELASYAFNLAKLFNKFYAENSILKAEAEEVLFRVDLSRKVADCLQSACLRLGIEMPERM
jgi:arginyl-tRNA synthetase